MTTAIRSLLKSVLILAALGLSQAKAQLIVSNIENPVGFGGTVGSDNWFAQAFITPSDTAYFLDSLALKLEKQDANQGTFTVSLWSAAANGQPESLISQVGSVTDVSTLTTSFAPYTFNAPAGITLAASTTYFVVLGASATLDHSGLLWADTTQLNPPKTGPGQIGGWTASADQGQNWEAIVPTVPFQIAVFGTPVPEPASYVLVAGLALVAFALVRRLRVNHATSI